MKQLLLSFLLLFSSYGCTTEATTPLDPRTGRAITYELTGRLGNNLIAYLHGRWAAWKYHMPLLYKPFPYADQFAFHDYETHLYKEWSPKFAREVNLARLDLLKIAPASTIFRVPYFRDEGPRAGILRRMVFKTDWYNPEFRKLVKALLKPRRPVETVKPPADMWNVLVHVRTGGGFDDLPTRLAYAYKFPPHSFYIEALRRLSQHIQHAPLYAYIMTDDPDAASLARMYQEALSEEKNIIFDYRKAPTGPACNVIEDFYTIPNFKCLIRGDSTFSIMATLLANFKVVMCPKKCHVRNKEVVVDAIDFQTFP